MYIVYCGNQPHCSCGELDNWTQLLGGCNLGKVWQACRNSEKKAGGSGGLPPETFLR